MRYGNYGGVVVDETCPTYMIEQRIKYHETQRDFYCGNARAKKSQQKEINKLKKYLERK